MMRDAEKTRQNILAVSADEIHKHGFKATSLSTILSRCQISKGALYHHFENKQELGYAVFEEVFVPMFLQTWQPALTEQDPIEGLCAFFSGMTESVSYDEFVCGCPLNNLCQEMAAVDEGFRKRIFDMQQQLNHMIVTSLDKISQKLRPNLDLSQVAFFIVSCFHGAMSLSKSAQSTVLFNNVIDELCHYIRQLKKQ